MKENRISCKMRVALSAVGVLMAVGAFAHPAHPGTVAPYRPMTAGDFHRCHVSGETEPGAWVVSNCGQVTRADEKGRYEYLALDEVDTDEWYEELKKMLKESM